MPSHDRPTAIALTVLALGEFAGAIFGALFIALYQILTLLTLKWQTLIIASLAAAMTTVALQLDAGGDGRATSGVIAFDRLPDPQRPAHRAARHRRCRRHPRCRQRAVLYLDDPPHGTPLAETLTGLLSGLVAGVILSVVLHFYPGNLSAFVMAAGIVALVGSLFQLNEHWIVQVCSGWLPAGLAAPMVSALIAAVVAASIWMMSGTTAAAMDLATKAVIDGVVSDVPEGFLGGMLGGAITGLVLELLGFHVEEHEGRSLCAGMGSIRAKTPRIGSETSGADARETFDWPCAAPLDCLT